MSVPELGGNPLMLRVFQLFDIDGDGDISWEEFQNAIALLRDADKNESGRRKRKTFSLINFLISVVSRVGFVQHTNSFDLTYKPIQLCCSCISCV